jgi:ABC-2 type transport system permease protein
MNRMFAIIEREMRKFFRSPTLMVTAMIMPLVQLIILGNAFGGKIRDARVGIVDEDHGTQAVRVQEAFRSVEANIRTFRAVPYTDEVRAREDVRQGRLEGALIIPSQFSRRFYAGENPQLGMVVDNSDQFMASSVQTKMQELVTSLNQPTATSKRISGDVALEIIELYPYVEYLKYLLPGSITLAMFVSVMIGGGMLYIDDKARGVHEGYLVTPITAFEMVLGLNLAGAFKAIMAGCTLTILGSLIAGLGSSFQPERILQWFLLICATSFAFNGMMFLLMVRVEDPLVPRAMFGILNTLLYFPSGAIYPVQAFPKWLQVISYVDPFSFAVHGLKATLLKESSWAAVSHDLLYLSLFGFISMAISVPLFKRTL